MACKFRRTILTQVKQTLKNGPRENIVPRNTTLKFNKPCNAVEMHVSLSKTMSCNENKISSSYIDSVSQTSDKRGNNLIFKINKNEFMSEVVDNVHRNPNSFWKKSDLFDDRSPQKVLLEFSSPNIAKPFHIGHLRSTIIGNFLSNLHAALEHHVVRINYLGDWGTQFGLLNVGLQLGNVSDAQIEENPIQTLYEAYVVANQRAETDPAVHEKAREIFRQLEEGNFPEIKRWEKFRGYTVKELESTYARLGVKFDEYQWESMFGAREIRDVLDSLRSQGILTTSPEGRQTAKVGDRNVTLVKSDGSSLYLTRDIAAALYRYEKHKFHKLLYIVDNSQSDHFTSLRHLLTEIGHSWSETGIRHVKFGRVHGMSTRKGQVVFLKDILDEARDRVVLRQQQSANTRPNLPEETSDVLAVSAVLVNDLKQRRQRDYNFDWDSAMQTVQSRGTQRSHLSFSM
ncbi:UNVERIFIED_CONTAM: hypothetical protein B566_EDAN018304 [Ephemera danica]|nr:hypothetical protein B566_EDAN018304 [Ephemera danica]